MTEKQKPSREQIEGHEVWVAKDEGGITAVAEDEEAADPRVTTGDDADEEPADDDADN